jgi:hypothetical protein
MSIIPCCLAGIQRVVVHDVLARGFVVLCFNPQLVLYTLMCNEEAELRADDMDLLVRYACVSLINVWLHTYKRVACACPRAALKWTLHIGIRLTG